MDIYIYVYMDIYIYIYVSHFFSLTWAWSSQSAPPRIPVPVRSERSVPTWSHGPSHSCEEGHGNVQNPQRFGQALSVNAMVFTGDIYRET